MKPSSPKISVVVSTYNWPEALALFLESAIRQKTKPYEVLVADDGSGEPTRKLVESYAARAPFPIRHVWHEDRGFRLAAIRNKAIAVAAGDYIVMTDGDIIMHPDFIRDHGRAAERGYFSAGSRIDLPAGYTARLTASGNYSGFRLFLSSLSSPMKGLHLPRLGKLFRNRHSGTPFHGRGCNLAAWRDDLEAINGFDESYEGWGREDTDLMCRLMKLGRRKRTLRLCTVSYHLHHKTRNSDDDLSRNDEILRRAMESPGFRCANGIVKDR